MHKTIVMLLIGAVEFVYCMNENIPLCVGGSKGKAGMQI